MKMKKLVPFLALVMGLSTFGGCTNADQKIIFGSLWYTNTNSDAEAIHETLTYDVKFVPSEGGSFVNYKLNYKDGSYTTTLVSEGAGENLVYTYTKQLSIVAQYTLNDTTVEKMDTVTSEVKFKADNYGFQPISSKKEIISHSPTGNNVATIDKCYSYFHYTVATTYQNACTEGKSVTTEFVEKEQNGEIVTAGDPIVKESTFAIDQDKYTYLDNEQLLAAVRCIRNSTTAATVNVYSPFVNTVQNISLSFAADASKEFSFMKDGEAKKETITYRPLSIKLDESNSGATQTAWIAKHEDVNGINKYRNIILQLETPLSYNLGTLQYTLTSIAYQA